MSTSRFKVYWLAPTLEKFDTLPSTWHNISPFNEGTARSHGWVKCYERVEDEPASRTCTKYELIACLNEHYPSLLASLKEAYAADTDLQFFWNTVIQLDRDNDDFKAAVSKLGVTEEQLDDIFSKIVRI